MGYIDVTKLNTGENASRTLGTIKINGVVFKSIGHGMLRTANVVTYRETPGRTADFEMPDLPKQTRRVVPHIEIGFKWIDADEFVKLRQILISRTQMEVEYYDNDFGKYMTHQMYAQPDDLKAFESLGQKVRGVTNFTVELVGTMNGEPTVSVSFCKRMSANEWARGQTYQEGQIVKITNGEWEDYYIANQQTTLPPAESSDTFWSKIDTAVSATNVMWGKTCDIKTISVENVDGKRFANKYVNSNGEIYYVGESINVVDNLQLLAVYE